MTWLPRVEAKAIRSPSGNQLAKSSCPWSELSWRAFVPSELMSQMFLFLPVRQEVNARRLPSGEKAGREFLPTPLVRRLGAASFSFSESETRLLDERSAANATFVPSAETATRRIPVDPRFRSSRAG